MKKLCQLLKLSEEELFKQIVSSFKNKITGWDYFVNWDKVKNNVLKYEKELNLLNYLIGKENLYQEIVDLLTEYPNVIKVIPALLAIRGHSVEVLVDTQRFIYKNFNFNQQKYSQQQIKDFAEFILKTGLGNLLKDKSIKNLVDYITGVEVGLDSNGRKNRGGSLMERIVEEFVAQTCLELGLEYMEQATAPKIKERWNVDVEVDKSSRRIDFAVNKNSKLFFIEVNFYGGGGSKLKSTATEYIRMNEFWNSQGIEFIWITDGAGWKNTLRPLREYFDKADYLLNLEMLKNGALKKILQ